MAGRFGRNSGGGSQRPNLELTGAAKNRRGLAAATAALRPNTQELPALSEYQTSLLDQFLAENYPEGMTPSQTESLGLNSLANSQKVQVVIGAQLTAFAKKLEEDPSEQQRPASTQDLKRDVAALLKIHPDGVTDAVVVQLNKEALQFGFSKKHSYQDQTLKRITDYINTLSGIETKRSKEGYMHPQNRHVLEVREGLVFHKVVNLDEDDPTRLRNLLNSKQASGGDESYEEQEAASLGTVLSSGSDKNKNVFLTAVKKRATQRNAENLAKSDSAKDPKTLLDGITDIALMGDEAVTAFWQEFVPLEEVPQTPEASKHKDPFFISLVFKLRNFLAQQIDGITETKDATSAKGYKFFERLKPSRNSGLTDRHNDMINRVYMGVNQDERLLVSLADVYQRSAVEQRFNYVRNPSVSSANDTGSLADSQGRTGDSKLMETTTRRRRSLVDVNSQSDLGGDLLPGLTPFMQIILEADRVPTQEDLSGFLDVLKSVAVNMPPETLATVITWVNQVKSKVSKLPASRSKSNQLKSLDVIFKLAKNPPVPKVPDNKLPPAPQNYEYDVNGVGGYENPYRMAIADTAGLLAVVDSAVDLTDLTSIEGDANAVLNYLERPGISISDELKGHVLDWVASLQQFKLPDNDLASVLDAVKTSITDSPSPAVRGGGYEVPVQVPGGADYEVPRSLYQVPVQLPPALNLILGLNFSNGAKMLLSLLNEDVTDSLGAIMRQVDSPKADAARLQILDWLPAEDSSLAGQHRSLLNQILEKIKPPVISRSSSIRSATTESSESSGDLGFGPEYEIAMPTFLWSEADPTTLTENAVILLAHVKSNRASISDEQVKIIQEWVGKAQLIDAGQVTQRNLLEVQEIILNPISRNGSISSVSSDSSMSSTASSVTASSVSGVLASELGGTVIARSNSLNAIPVPEFLGKEFDSDSAVVNDNLKTLLTYVTENSVLPTDAVSRDIQAYLDEIKKTDLSVGHTMKKIIANLPPTADVLYQVAGQGRPRNTPGTTSSTVLNTQQEPPYSLASRHYDPAAGSSIYNNVLPNSRSGVDLVDAPSDTNPYEMGSAPDAGQALFNKDGIPIVNDAGQRIYAEVSDIPVTTEGAYDLATNERPVFDKNGKRLYPIGPMYAKASKTVSGIESKLNESSTDNDIAYDVAGNRLLDSNNKPVDTKSLISGTDGSPIYDNVNVEGLVAVYDNAGDILCDDEGNQLYALASNVHVDQNLEGAPNDDGILYDKAGRMLLNEEGEPLYAEAFDGGIDSEPIYDKADDGSGEPLYDRAENYIAVYDLAGNQRHNKNDEPLYILASSVKGATTEQSLSKTAKNVSSVLRVVLHPESIVPVAEVPVVETRRRKTVGFAPNSGSYREASPKTARKKTLRRRNTRPEIGATQPEIGATQIAKTKFEESVEAASNSSSPIKAVAVRARRFADGDAGNYREKVKYFIAQFQSSEATRDVAEYQRTHQQAEIVLPPTKKRAGIIANYKAVFDATKLETTPANRSYVPSYLFTSTLEGLPLVDDLSAKLNSVSEIQERLDRNKISPKFANALDSMPEASADKSQKEMALIDLKKEGAVPTVLSNILEAEVELGIDHPMIQHMYIRLMQNLAHTVSEVMAPIYAFRNSDQELRAEQFTDEEMVFLRSSIDLNDAISARLGLDVKGKDDLLNPEFLHKERHAGDADGGGESEMKATPLPTMIRQQVQFYFLHLQDSFVSIEQSLQDGQNIVREGERPIPQIKVLFAHEALFTTPPFTSHELTQSVAAAATEEPVISSPTPDSPASSNMPSPQLGSPVASNMPSPSLGSPAPSNVPSPPDSPAASRASSPTPVSSAPTPPGSPAASRSSSVRSSTAASPTPGSPVSPRRSSVRSSPTQALVDETAKKEADPVDADPIKMEAPKRKKIVKILIEYHRLGTALNQSLSRRGAYEANLEDEGFQEGDFGVETERVALTKREEATWSRLLKMESYINFWFENPSTQGDYDQRMKNNWFKYINAKAASKKELDYSGLPTLESMQIIPDADLEIGSADDLGYGGMPYSDYGADPAVAHMME